jgi:hypothetical protein
MNKWFYVMDMHSGGGRKTKYEMYFIEAADECDARERFTAETGEDPDDVQCDCCGANFSVGGESDTLEECAKYWAERRGGVDEYINGPRNLVKVLRWTREDILL